MEIAEPTIKPLYTAGEVMRLFKITRPTLQDWCHKGVLKKITIPGQRRVYVSGASVEKIINPK